MDTAATTSPKVDYQTHPDRYRHYKVSYDGPVATLALDIDEDAGIRPGYKLKLNSYDLGVDIELHDAIQRIRFEHPEVRTVVLTSAKDRIFCSGANIFMQAAVAPGGVFLLQGYRPEQVDYATGGPPRRDHMYTRDWLTSLFRDFEILVLREYDAVIEEGRAHAGKSALVDFVARKAAG